MIIVIGTATGIVREASRGETRTTSMMITTVFGTLIGRGIMTETRRICNRRKSRSCLRDLNFSDPKKQEPISSTLSCLITVVERRLVGFQLAGWRASGVKWESCWFFDVYIWRPLLFYTAIIHRLQFWLPFFTDFLAFFSFDSKINFHLNSSPSVARLALASDQVSLLMVHEL
ncbi:hypothetical protein L3X38_040383 [Prunus dulcis]|uniref:Uncharacterized protein n=1 Tax=Prunus dulcis TaxID=3755 RepID=A0AAD4V8Z7_PRUDU|nr:hypothetical protein L3X38_040383 [Prunus dulcis]